jgi:hypothetical protein
VQGLTKRLSSAHQGEAVEQFFHESPIPTDPHPYQALEIFWGYNFFNYFAVSPTPKSKILACGYKASG